MRINDADRITQCRYKTKLNLTLQTLSIHLSLASLRFTLHSLYENYLMR